MWVEHVLKTKWPSSVMEPHSNFASCWQRLLCGSIDHTACSLLFTPVTTGQHLYMQLVSVLYKPVSSIPTSLSFFYPSFNPFIRSRWSMKLHVGGTRVEKTAVTNSWQKGQTMDTRNVTIHILLRNFKLNQVRNNHLYRVI